jgi:outer membrane immunogenic protein
VFATGGLAAGGVNSNGSVIVPNSSLVPVWGGSSSTVKIGFTVGGGAELALSDRWSAKADYLWYDLGRVSHPLDCISASPTTCTAGTFGSGVYPTLGNAVSSVRGSIIRVGLNYRLN